MISVIQSGICGRKVAQPVAIFEMLRREAAADIDLEISVRRYKR